MSKLKKVFSQRERNLRRYRRKRARAGLDPSSILFEQQCGVTANGNLYHVAKALRSSSEYDGMSVAFAVERNHLAEVKREFDARHLDAEIVERRSRRYYDLLAQAKWLFCDTSFPPEFSKRTGQALVNTWHGTPLKTLGRLIPGEQGLIGNVQKCFLSADVLLFANEFSARRFPRDYMFDGFANGSILLSGYPRNAALLKDADDAMRRAHTGGASHVYAYMPTFRTTSADGSKLGAADEIAAHLKNLDALLDDDEVLFAQLHPTVSDTLDLSALEHVKPFPSGIETYDFLATCDVLVTDYSSVMFDFAITRRKVVLFTFDEERYLDQRGTYLDMDELPFPRVRDVHALADELRTPKAYDDGPFLERFCPYESADAALDLCHYVFDGTTPERAETRPVGHAARKALVYAESSFGDAQEEAMAAIAKLQKTHEVMFAFPAKLVKEDPDLILSIPEGVSFLPVAGSTTHLFGEVAIRALAGRKLISERHYARAMSRWESYEIDRALCGMRFDVMVYCAGPDWHRTHLLGGADAARKMLVQCRNAKVAPTFMADYEKRAFDVRAQALTPDAIDLILDPRL